MYAWRLTNLYILGISMHLPKKNSLTNLSDQFDEGLCEGVGGA